MSGIVVVILAMSFAAVVLAVQGVYFYLRGIEDEEESKVRRRLGFDPDEEEEALASLLRESASDGALDSLGRMGENLQMEIAQSGLELTVSGLTTQMLVAFLAVFVAGFFIVGPIALLLAPIAGYLPLARVRRTAAKRAKDLLGQMPDALELMGRAMQAGTGLMECFHLVQLEMPEPIAAEFGRVYDEVRFGKDWRNALEELVARNPTLFDLRLLVSSVLLQRETGGNMIETMARIAKLIRTRYLFDAKVKAMTSEARASGFILAVMPFGVLVMVLAANAPYLSPLWTTTAGQMCIVYAVASYIFGIFMMTSMSTVEA